jgi:hypothetical protein
VAGDLGRWYGVLRDYPKALEYLRDTRGRRERVLGPDHLVRTATKVEELSASDA